MDRWVIIVKDRHSNKQFELTIDAHEYTENRIIEIMSEIHPEFDILGIEPVKEKSELRAAAL